MASPVMMKDSGGRRQEEEIAALREGSQNSDHEP